MNLVWQIVAKDFRRLRGRLAAWLAVLGAKYVIGFWVLHSAEVSARTFTNLQGAVGGLVIVDLALTWLLAALLVHEDPVAGTAAFWRTRPIAGSRLLAAKVLGMALFFLVPAVLAAVPWWVACRLTAGQMTAAAIEVVVVQGGVVLLAAAAACVTDTLARCLVWGLVGLAGAYGLAGAWMQMRFFPSGSSPGAILWAWWLLLAVLLAVLVVWQFLTRRRRVGLGLLLTGVVLAPPVAPFLMKGVAAAIGARVMEGPAKRGSTATQGISVEWISARRNPPGPARWSGQIELNYEARGVPPGHLVAARFARHSVQSGGRPLVVRQNAVGGENQGLLAMRIAESDGSALGGAGGPRTIPLRSWFLLQPEDQVATRGQPLDVAVDLRLHLVRPEIIDAIPAQPGPWRARAGRGARVMRVTRPETEAVAMVLESEPLAVVRSVWYGWHGGQISQNVIHVVQREGVALRALSTQVRASLILGGVQLRQRTIVLGRAAEGTTVTRVDLSDGVPFACTVTIPRLDGE